MSIFKSNKKILPSPDCTVCKKTANRIHSDLFWCPNCGTLHHPTGAAWFQAGEMSVPRLAVDHYCKNQSIVLEESGDGRKPPRERI